MSFRLNGLNAGKENINHVTIKRTKEQWFHYKNVYPTGILNPAKAIENKN